MNSRIVVRVLGSLLILEAGLMAPSLLIALFNKESGRLAFSVTMAIMIVIGFLMTRVKHEQKRLNARDGLSIVTLGWIISTFFGALPFIISGSIPSFTDAIFETMSGLTTTGATILADIEVLPRGILFWRSFTHWIGGMGILVFTVSLLPMLGIGGFQIFKAESPGPVADRIVPRIKDTAKILYITYIAITLVEIILLMFGGMSLYEACVHTFGTVGTGGFSIYNGSIGAYKSSYIHVVIAIFMIMSGTNFSLYFAIYQGKWRDVLKDEEWRMYIGVIAVATLLLTISLQTSIGGSIGINLRDSLFQTSSIITTTGYGTVDFDQWTTFGKSILFGLMFFGGCAGSTGGGIKQIRLLVLAKLVKREFAKIFHPRAMIPLRVNDRPVTSDVLATITSFFMLYIMLFVGGTIIISLEGLDLISSASAVAVTLGNVGPGFGFVGPTQTYAFFSDGAKWVFVVLMLLGRLELFTVIAFFFPSNFIRKNSK